MATTSAVGNYFKHYWLSFDRSGARLPKIFRVNGFRKSDDGKFLWPGFGENIRVLEWIVGRLDGSAAAVPHGIGLLPDPASVRLGGSRRGSRGLDALSEVDAGAREAEQAAVGAYLERYAAPPDS